MDTLTTRTRLSIRGARTRAVLVPMKRPLRTSVGTVTAAPLVLIDLETDQGIVGRAYLFSYVESMSTVIRQTIEAIMPSLIGESIEPLALRKRAAAEFALLGAQGILGICLSGLDMAWWDALSKSTALPLARFLGGSLSRIPAYNSNGLGIVGPEEAASEALELLDEGFTAIKVRLGRPRLEDDVAVVRAIRKRIPPDSILMSDFNHCLSTSEAIRRGRALDNEGLYWIEEPVAYDDFRACAFVAQSIATPIQLGEHLTTPHDMQSAMDQHSCQFIMLDVERIGGVTGWMQGAALAETTGMSMSSHLFPEVSCHLLAVTPSRHWLEYVDWAAPILAEPVRVEHGFVTVPDRPGNGITWDDDAVRHYATE